MLSGRSRRVMPGLPEASAGSPNRAPQLSAMCRRGTCAFMAGIQGLGERGTNVRSDPSPHIQYVDVVVGLLILFFFACLLTWLFVSALYDVGDMPYRVAAPLLQQCRPDQLRMIEDASPVSTTRTISAMPCALWISAYAAAASS